MMALSPHTGHINDAGHINDGSPHTGHINDVTSHRAY